MLGQVRLRAAGEVAGNAVVLLVGLVALDVLPVVDGLGQEGLRGAFDNSLVGVGGVVEFQGDGAGEREVAGVAKPLLFSTSLLTTPGSSGCGPFMVVVLAAPGGGICITLEAVGLLVLCTLAGASLLVLDITLGLEPLGLLLFGGGLEGGGLEKLFRGQGELLAVTESFTQREMGAERVLADLLITPEEEVLNEQVGDLLDRGTKVDGEETLEELETNFVGGDVDRRRHVNPA